jgi:hypothetical protein
MNTYKIKDNLFIDGNMVISYETHVATIEGERLIEHGRYSRTTSKHIHYVARLFGLSIEFGKQIMKGKFDKLEYGAKCFLENSISKNSSLKILDKMFNDGIEYKYAILSLEKEIPKKDWKLLDKECLEKMEDDEKLGVRALLRAGIF